MLGTNEWRSIGLVYVSLYVMIRDMSWKSEKRRRWWGQNQREGMLQGGPSKHRRGRSAGSVWSPYQTQQRRANLFQHGFTGAVTRSSWRLMVFLIHILSSVIIRDVIGFHVNAECSVTKNRGFICRLTLSWHVDPHQFCLHLKGRETKGS